MDKQELIKELEKKHMHTEYGDEGGGLVESFGCATCEAIDEPDHTKRDEEAMNKHMETGCECYACHGYTKTDYYWITKLERDSLLSILKNGVSAHAENKSQLLHTRLEGHEDGSGEQSV